MSTLKPKNWEEHQHYKDRNPPWIKFKTATFRDYHFSKLSNQAKLLLFACWTMASQSKEGEFVNDFDFIINQCNLTGIKPEHLQELVKQGFLQSSEVLAYCLQDATPTVSVSHSVSHSVDNNDDLEFLEFWKNYPPNRGAKKEANKSYLKARKTTDHETIIRGAKSYAADIRRNPRPIDKIAHATTWLNQERWTIDYDIELTTARVTPIKGSRESDPLLMGAERAMRRAVETDNLRRQNEVSGE